MSPTFTGTTGRPRATAASSRLARRLAIGWSALRAVGNPISATFMDGFTAEVLRACVHLDAPRNGNSFLYGACWRVWRAMGGRRLVTYTLQDESGASLRGAGWRCVGEVKPTGDGWRKNDHLSREWQPVMGQLKFRWEIADEVLL